MAFFEQNVSYTFSHQTNSTCHQTDAHFWCLSDLTPGQVKYTYLGQFVEVKEEEKKEEEEKEEEEEEKEGDNENNIEKQDLMVIRKCMRRENNHLPLPNLMGGGQGPIQSKRSTFCHRQVPTGISFILPHIHGSASLFIPHKFYP